MSMNKKILAVAILGGLFAGSAQAAVTFAATPTNAPVTVATEAFGTADATGTAFLNPGSVFDIISPLNYAFSPSEVRYARVECPSNVKFVTASVPTIANATAGAINGLGTSAIYFSITANAAAPSPTGATTFTIDGTRNITNGAAATCSYSLYDQPSQAQAGGTPGRIATASGAYVNFASGYLFATNSQQTLTADVEASTGSFTKFTPLNSPVSSTLGRLTALRHDVVAGRLDEDGLDIALADIFGANTAIDIAGDFSFVTGAANVFLASDTACTVVVQAASSITASSAKFTIGANARSAGADTYLCVTPNTTTAIPAGSYTATLNAVVANPIEYSASNTGPLAAGSIVRNGTELQAPLVQLPGNGWLSRMVLTNTGGVARPYTVSVLRETGSAGTTGALTGTVPANGTIVVDINTILPSFSAGLPRATLNVTVAGPDKQIQGLYQIVNANSLTISNHAMIRPGTN